MSKDILKLCKLELKLSADLGIQIRRIEAFQNLAQNKSVQKFHNKRNDKNKCMSNYLAFLMRRCQLRYRKKINWEQNMHVLLWFL